ncbi:MAG: lectin like domain-containing protein [Dissulfurispiraceae bacterium]
MLTKQSVFKISLTALAILMLMLAGASFAGDLGTAPINPAFIERLNLPPKAVQQNGLNDVVDGLLLQPIEAPITPGHSLGYMPSPHDMSHLTGQSVTPPVESLMAAGVAVTDTAPNSYDLRTLGKVSPVKDQGQCGDCWAYGTYGSMESDELPISSLIFSENNLNNTSGFDIGACNGGDYYMSQAYLARWSGPVLESLDPDGPSMVSPGNLPAAAHVQDVLMIPDRANATDNSNIKTALQTYGAVATTMYYDESGASLNSSNYAYYFHGSAYSNHAVTIVGWDDNYPASNFNSNPAGNGAFIIKNSWGTGWGLNGYFYISYYDSNVGTENAVFVDAESTANYKTIYQYDPLGWVVSTGYGSPTAWFANVFTATANDSVGAVSFYTPAVNSTYSISVYTNVTGSSPTIGTLSGAAITGTIPYPGYHTVTLNTPVPIVMGQKFSVVVDLTTPGYTYPISIQYPYSGYSSKATASTGQSYISSNGTSWTDLTTQYANSSVCLKAFTTGSSSNPTCTFSISPTSGSFTDVAELATINVTTQAGCAWATSDSLAWATIASGGTGTGSGIVKVNIASNTSSSVSRSGNMTIAGQSYTVVQAGLPCTYIISPASNNSVSANGGTFPVAVTAPTGCSWSTSDSLTWATIGAGASGSGSGTVSLNVAANTNITSRTGTVTIASQAFTVTQAGMPCNYSLSASSSASLSANGATGSITVTATPSTCTWTATDPLSWATITSGGSGTGNGVVNYAASANSTYIARSGSMTIAGQTYTVNQAGQPCTYSIGSSSSNSLSYAGATGSITVTAPAGCGWSVADGLSWATITSGGTGTGTGTVNYLVSSNASSSAPRTGTMTVAGKTYTVNQGGAPCTATITTPSSSVIPAAGGTLNIGVTIPYGCSWNAANGLSWITIVSGASGTGSGTVQIKTSANTSTASRTGNIAVAGQSYSVVQSGACSYTVNPQSAVNISASGVTGSISVTTQSGCQWSVADTLSWVTITSGSAGTGSGTVQYKVSTNNGTLRSGSMTVANQSFSITQNAACTYSIELTSSTMLPYAQNAPFIWPASGGNATIIVATQPGCSWSATSGQSWMTVTPAPAAGGSGSVTYTLPKNTGATRTGSWTLMINGEPLTLPIQEN